MHKTYVTFGQDHVHNINGDIFDKDCVAVITSETAIEGRNKAHEYFGLEFFTTYFESQFDRRDMKYFPRRYIKVYK